MRKRIISALMSVVLIAALIICSAASVGALDDKYTFDDIGMSLKIPKTFRVVTKDSQRSDEVFSQLGLDYDETMTAFNAANIYLQAFDPNDIYNITVTVASDDNSVGINNYSDITPAQREEVLNNFLSDPMCTSAVEVKHNGSIFFDLTLEGEMDEEKIFLCQSNSVINGMNINLTLQKTGEAVLPDEAKTLTNIVNSLGFDKITLRDSGPSFEWWRFLLWILVLAVISIVISIIYQQKNKAKKKMLEERRARRKHFDPDSDDSDGSDTGSDDSEMTFEEALGYDALEDYEARISADLDSFDINVSEKDPDKGVDYFEDNGDSIDDKKDYFDSYFKERTEQRSPASRAVGTAGAYIKIAFTHLGYFFKNIFYALFRRKK